MEILNYFGTFAAFAGGVVVITKFLNEIFKITSKGWKQAMAWIVAIIMAVFGFYTQTGFFANYGSVNEWYGWVLTVITGFGAGLAANGLYDINYIRIALDWIAQLFKKDTIVNK